MTKIQDAADLNFHMRELRADVDGAMLEVSRVPRHEVAPRIEEVCTVLGSVCAALEHSYTQHSASAEALAMSATFENAKNEPTNEVPNDVLQRDSDMRWALVEEPMSESRGADDVLKEFQLQLDALRESLREAGVRLGEVAGLVDSKPLLLPETISAVHATVGEAMRRAFLALRAATCLSRLGDSTRGGSLGE